MGNVRKRKINNLYASNEDLGKKSNNNNEISNQTMANGPSVKSGCSKDVNDQHSSHEDKLKSSLDDALSLMLNQFSHGNSQASASKSAAQACCSCKKTLNSSDIVYKLPCSHLVCFKCVKASNISIECSFCKKVSLINEVVRAHVK